MEENVNRLQYFSIKHRYLLLYFTLWAIRILTMAFLTFIIVVVCMYTIQPENESYIKLYGSVATIAKIITPILLVAWIGLKIVVVCLKKKLKVIKEKLRIIDDI